MNIQQSGDKKKTDVRKHHGKSPTKQIIARKKDTYCTNLVTLVGNLKASEENVRGLTRSYEFKKCAFVKTEKNYRLFRNLELQTGMELVQASSNIKTSVKDALKKNDDLVKALKAVCASAKDAKAKFGQLIETANKITAYKKDSSSDSQMIALGCPNPKDCNDKPKKQDCNDETQDAGNGCKNACTILDHLQHVPASLFGDMDIIYTTSSEILGIQSFASIKTLDKFQLDFEGNVKTFNDWLIAKMTAGKTAVDAAQKDLTDATTSLTDAGFALYASRRAVETADETKDYLCCPECKCLNDDDECGCHDLDNHADRLKNCKCKICDICQEVTGIYCTTDPDQQDSEY